MALTLRSNGLAGGLVSAAWWNDYYNLLTGVMTDQPVTIHNSITQTGGYGIVNNGQIGLSVAGDLFDGSSGSTIYIKSTSSSGYVKFQFPSGTDSMVFSANAIQVPAWLGIRKINGTKLAEFLGNGNFLIAGGTFQSTGGTPTLAGGGSFDSFDIAEIFPCETTYSKGTVVCPGMDNLLHQCTHDNCPCALVVSSEPGLALGIVDPAQGHNLIAMAGRVNVLTSHDFSARQMVVSDGRGGVRPLKTGEGSFVLGFTLNQTAVVDGHPQVGIFLRPLFVTLKG